MIALKQTGARILFPSRVTIYKIINLVITFNTQTSFHIFLNLVLRNLIFRRAPYWHIFVPISSHSLAYITPYMINFNRCIQIREFVTRTVLKTQ